jgi:hypothetical protein
MTTSTKLALAKMALNELSKKERLMLMDELMPKESKAASETRLIRRTEAAWKLGCSKRAIDKWSREGILQRVKIPGRKHSAGYRLADIERLIIGCSTPSSPMGDCK